MLAKKLSMQGKIFEYNDIKPDEYAKILFDKLKDNTHCYIMTNDLNLVRMITSFEAVGFHFIKSLIWDKGNKIVNMFYMNQFEYILFFRKGKAKKINNPGTGTILSVPNKKTKDENGNNIHDCEKPVKLMEILILNSTKENETVLDCFMGSGSTGVAAKALNRNFIGIEIDDKYFDIARRRIEKEFVQEEIIEDELSKYPLFE